MPASSNKVTVGKKQLLVMNIYEGITPCMIVKQQCKRVVGRNPSESMIKKHFESLQKIYLQEYNIKTEELSRELRF